ncbi:tRNA (N(6)-L-threonylcarbamoyladenosine(37)-C(2))-methylthiotransferase [uncultured Fibrobacter sp.]|uniref:tRNA (N(6)-L-threonylcarbamoyladenosine(37)-C(2))- methylthiotransferase n=1 Tax=uncultured Fibrobacter sp. TaxID=261512 RepID=UPI0025F4A9AC|nr:tRNA (N(6)-L-threonylcarbamoyladenosine(37)-C(2))-methylthiotransferase [uncultured Fibrobacter sp.]
MQAPLVAIVSQGCAANFGDGERIARLLAKKFRTLFNFPTDEIPEAIYLNVCTVKGNAGAIKLLKKAHEAYPEARIYITGCAPADFRKEASAIFNKIEFTSLKNIAAEIIGESSKDTRQATLRESPFTGIVNIEEGCLDACAFCSTHLVKGRLHSYSAESIIEQVQSLVADGCNEIQLTGQDCGCYGFDTGTNLAKLVQNILVHVPGDYKLRLGMGNPRHMLSYAESLLECFTDSRVYKFIHLPVQSGSERILKAMNRRHTASDFVSLAETFNKNFDKFTLSTDMIVGFPGETEEDFDATLELLKETRPTVCNITRFVARPGTPAFAMNQTNSVSDDEKHRRSALLAETFQKIARENNARWIGHETEVHIEKEGHRSGTTIARNEAYNPVAIPGEFAPGKKLRVRITGAEPFALIAEPL